MQRSTRFDVSASTEEEYFEEIDLAMFIQPMLIIPALEPRAATLSDLAIEVISATEAASVLRATVTGKGIYVSPPKKMLPTKPNVCIPVSFATRVLTGETSGLGRERGKAMDVLAPIFVASVIQEAIEASALIQEMPSTVEVAVPIRREWTQRRNPSRNLGKNMSRLRFLFQRIRR